MSIVRPVEATQGEVSYRIGWDFAGTTVAADGSWSVVTDLGYTVTVHGGSLTTYSATLVSCPHTHGVLDRIFGLLSPAIAWAGHSSEVDPALVGGPLAQSITDPATVELGSTSVHEPSYCEGHTNWGSGGIPTSVSVENAAPTLQLTGTWQAPDDPTVRPLEISSTLNWGVKSSLTSADTSRVFAEVGTEPVEITLIRGLATAFDGVDFAAADEESIATSFLRSVAAATSFVVSGGTVHPA